MKPNKILNSLIQGFFVFIFIIVPTFQNESQIVIKLRYPIQNKVSNDDLWKIKMFKNTTHFSFMVYLQGTIINGNNGDVIWTGTTASFFVDSNFSKQIEQKDLTPITGKFNVAYKYVKESFLKKGKFPSGNYILCINIINYENKNELGHDCVQVVVTADSFFCLIYPVNNEIITEPSPIFKWSFQEKTLLEKPIKYHLIIKQLLKNQTPREAMKKNPVWFKTENIQSTSFQYPESAKKFKSGNTYVWQVICKEPYEVTGLKSKIGTFVFHKK